MTGLVVRGQALVVLVDDVALLLHAHYNLEQRLLDLLLRDQLLVAACRKQRCLIEQVFEVCTGEAGGRLGNFRELDIRVELLVAGMYLEDSLTTLDIRCADIDLTVKTARTQQCVIQNILAVGGCDDDNASFAPKPSISTSSWFRSARARHGRRRDLRRADGLLHRSRR